MREYIAVIQGLYYGPDTSVWAKLLSNIVAAYGIFCVIGWLLKWKKRASLLPVRRPHIVITGAARGLGEMIVHELFKTGEEMVITGVDLSWEADEINAPENVKFTKLSADLSEEQNIYALWDKIVQTNGPVHLLINNAGVAKMRLFKELEFKSYVHTFKTNLFAPVLLTKLFLQQSDPAWKQQRTKICQISSIVGVTGMTAACNSEYAPSKAALNGFTDTLRQELIAENSKISVCNIQPYHISTAMFKGVQARAHWILPVLDTKYVAKRTVDAIYADEEEVYIPGIAYWMAIVMLCVRGVTERGRILVT